MAEEQAQERTEQATPKRLKEAREKGQVARSRELSTVAVMLAAAGAVFVFGSGMISGFSGLFSELLRLERARLFDHHAMLDSLSAAILQALWILAPLFGLLAVAAIVAPLAVGGWVFSSQSIAFKWEKLDPVKGMQRVFSARGLMELVKALAKFTLVCAVGILLIWHFLGELLGLQDQPLQLALAHAGHLLGIAMLVLSASLILIAMVDVPFQLWNHAKQMRMTRQEVKDEYKETDGRPEVKSRIRELQRAIARGRMMEAVPKADVVVTNPAHFAVALRYEPKRQGAPRVVAKGRDLVAANIRKVAGEHSVPLVSAPPLARALFFSTELEQEIPAGLYVAVAQVLAYVYELKRPGANPEPPSDLPIPDDLAR